MNNLLTLISNTYKNVVGSERDLLQLIADRDVSKAKMLFRDYTSVSDKGLKEYNPDTHEVIDRKDKKRRGRDDYQVEKLPRNWQEYINEIALFFLLANPIEWKSAKEDNDALNEFKDMLKKLRFNSFMRQAKRIAGSEGIFCKHYRIFKRSDGTPDVEIIPMCRSNMWDARPLFDQFGHLIANSYGYYTNEAGKAVEHFDIETSANTYRCVKGNLGVWDIDVVPNPTGKINSIIYIQAYEWDKGRRRIHRDELLDCKIADTNNYFADPIAIGTADVIASIMDPETPGKLMQMGGKDSDFRYINPPTSAELQKAEKENNQNAIHQDTFTPNFDFEKMVGLGTLSGEALKRALILGYIKRTRNIEIYEPLVDREKNVILAIMQNVTHIHMKAEIEKLKGSLSFTFAEPFSEDVSKKITDLSLAVNSNIMSVDEAVRRLNMSDDVEEEIKRINDDKESLAV